MEYMRREINSLDGDPGSKAGMRKCRESDERNRPGVAEDAGDSQRRGGHEDPGSTTATRGGK